MPTLRTLIDQPREIFDATLAAHNERKVGTKHRQPRREPRVERRQVEACACEQRSVLAQTNQYVYEVAAMGERLQHEYSRGYSDGYRDGVQAGAVKSKPVEVERQGSILQNTREVNLEE